MKNLFLLIVAPVLLVTLGVAQTPPPSSTTDQPGVKGCLAGTDGNYTVAEDGTTQIYKVTSSTVDLKPHVGHDIEVTGQKTNATSSGPADNSVVVTAVNMISDHCATPAASASPAAAVVPAVADTTPPATTSTPVAADTTTATASAPVATDATPAATVSTPVATPAVTVSTPVAADPPPTAAASTPVADPTPAPTASEPAQPVGASATTNELPGTATSLPLLGLLGLGALLFGLMSWKSRTS
jgi:hypothetical protein